MVMTRMMKGEEDCYLYTPRVHFLSKWQRSKQSYWKVLLADF